MSELEERVAAIKRRIRSSLDSLANYQCPILGVDRRDKPFVIGSSVIMSISDRLFLASAAHVFDENEHSSL